MEQPVPARRLRAQLLPAAQPGNRRIDDCQSPQIGGKLAREGIGNDAAHVVPDEVNRGDLELGKQ